ncbi:alpha/beta fold hydrolase [Streptomyces sp. M19]
MRSAHARGELAAAVPLLASAARYRPAFDSPAELADPPAAVLVSDGAAEPAVICVPSFLAGSGPHQFARLAAGFGTRRQVFALTLPGFGKSLCRPPVGTPPSRPWPTRRGAAGEAPALLLGHSIGGALAHAVAARLEREGHPVAGAVLIDTYEPDPAERSEVFAWAMGAVLDRDHAYVDVNETNVLAMGGYLGLFDGWAADELAAPSC